MNLFKFVRKHFFDKQKSTEFANLVEGSETLISTITAVEEIDYESDVLAPICVDNFLDTTSPLSIAKYKNNLRLLVESAKQNGKIENFKIIRDDNYFPYDWEWRVASKNTGIESSNNYLSYMIKTTIANKNLGVSKHESFWIPVDSDKLNKEMSKLDRNLGALLMPVRFRSTKHFTVNTPLSYTGEYNAVESNRNFTVIDDMDSFLSSGYAYSADYRDAYLDVTHESLKISNQAIILISEDKYSTVLKDPIVARQLQERRVIIYRGDEAVAINMILTESGILPSRPGNKYIVYDNQIRDILEQSMRNLCSKHRIEYAKGHGNLNGKGGHFSDLYDGYNHDYDYAQEQFIDFLKKKFPNLVDLISYNILRDSLQAEKFIETVGVDTLLSTIEEYNNLVRLEFDNRFQKYKDNRATITPEISSIFKQTVALIDDFYSNDREATLSVDILYQFRELVRLFYHSDTVEAQLLAATKLSNIFGITIVSENYTSNSYSV